MGARLEWALLNYFIDCHLADGYEFILPPHMLEYQCGETAGQFPKFADEVYKIQNPTDDRIHFMLPTAEAALASVYRGRDPLRGGPAQEVLRLHPLLPPGGRVLTAPSERGMVRGHQFNKVEMFQYTRPEDSDDAFDELVGKAEDLVKGLGFHFRTVQAGCGRLLRFHGPDLRHRNSDSLHERLQGSAPPSPTPETTRPAAATSASAARPPASLEFVHTLNGSGLATSRIFPAMVEQNQLQGRQHQSP